MTDTANDIQEQVPDSIKAWGRTYGFACVMWEDAGPNGYEITVTYSTSPKEQTEEDDSAEV